MKRFLNAMPLSLGGHGGQGGYGGQGNNGGQGKFNFCA